MNLKRIWPLIKNEPYRFFFPAGILFGLIGTGHWLAFSAGLSSTASGFFHASVQIWLYMGSFVAGFLMTAVPRFASARNADTFEIIGVFSAMAAALFFLTMGVWAASGIAQITSLALLLVFIGRRFLKKGRSSSPPVEFVWIPVAFMLAIAGMVLTVLSQADRIGAHYMAMGRSLSSQGFLLCLVMGVGGFLGTRLMGLYAMPEPGKLQMAFEENAQRRRWHLVAAIFLLLSFLAEGQDRWPPAYWLRALVVTLDLGWVSRALRPPKAPGLFPRLLSLSFWLVCIGLWGCALWPKQIVGMLHILFLGGFSLMTFLVATMVVLSHAGESQRLSKPLWILWAVAFGVLFSLATRLAAQWLPESFFLHIGAASAVWMLTGVVWLAFSWRFFWQVPGEAAWEHDHEKFKKGESHSC